MAEPAGAEPPPETVGKGQPDEEAGSDDAKAKIVALGHKAQVGAGELCMKLGNALDTAIDRVDDRLEKVEENLDDKSRCYQCIHAIRTFEDPVQMARCSPARVFFLAVCIAAAVFGVIAISGDEPDAWEFACGIFVALLAGFAGIFLGGDIFMIEAFQKVVHNIQKQINAFKKHNSEMRKQLASLKEVEAGLADVYEKMGNDVDATAALLRDMERYSSLQTVSAVVNQFFAADYDGKGFINGLEATLLTPQLESLWELVPTFDRSRFEEHVKKNGLNLTQLAVLLDTIVAEDRQSCLEELEQLVTGRDDNSARAEEAAAADAEAGAGRARDFVDEPEHEAPPPMCSFLDIEMGAMRPPKRLRPTVSHFADPPEKQPSKREAWSAKSVESLEDGEKKEEKGPLEPLYSVTICTLGPISGGQFSIWGYYHLALLMCIPVAITLFVQVLLDDGFSDVIHFALASVGLSFAFTLAAAGRLLEVLRALRKQIADLKVENSEFESSNKDLEKNITRLASLKRGFDKLQELCKGNVDEAKKLIKKGNTNIKMSAMAAVTSLFKTSDADRDQNLSEAECEHFFESLGLVFRSVKGFDLEEVKRSMNNQMTMLDVKPIVDKITSFNHADPEEAGRADESALRIEADAVEVAEPVGEAPPE